MLICLILCLGSFVAGMLLKEQVEAQIQIIKDKFK